MNKKRTLQNNLSYALKYIFDNYGINIFLDSEKFILTLSNLIPTLEEEIELVKFAIENKALLAVTKAHNMRDIDKEFAFLRAKNILMQNGLSEKTALYIVDCFVYAFNWTNETPNYKDLSDDDLKLPKNKSDNNINIKPIVKIEKNTETKIENKNIIKDTKQKQVSYNKQKEFLEKETIEEHKTYKNESKYYLNHNLNDDDYEDDNDDYDSPSLFKKIVLILIPIIVICSLAFVVFKNLNKEAIPVVSGISITTEYKTNAGNYILPIAQETDLNIILESENSKEIDESKLDYSIEDSSICSFKANGKKCKITGIKEGHTNLVIMYDDEEIDTISLYFEDFEKVDDEEDSKEEKDSKEEENNNASSSGSTSGGSSSSSGSSSNGSTSGGSGSSSGEAGGNTSGGSSGENTSGGSSGETGGNTSGGEAGGSGGSSGEAGGDTSN